MIRKDYAHVLDSVYNASDILSVFRRKVNDIINFKVHTNCSYFSPSHPSPDTHDLHNMRAFIDLSCCLSAMPQFALRTLSFMCAQSN